IHVLKDEAAWEMGQRALQRAEEFLMETEWFYRQGMASELDLGEARARLLAAQSSLNSAVRRLELARARLNQEIGQPLDAVFQLQALPEAGLWSQEVETVPPLSQQALEQALQRRLDVFQARLSVQQALL